MIRMTVQNMVVATGASLVAGDPAVVFEGVGIDSRAVPAGGAFEARNRRSALPQAARGQVRRVREGVPDWRNQIRR